MLRAARVAVISIHALREEGDRLVPVPRSIFAPISIHALREEGDPAKVCRRCMRSGISIHALREEGDRLDQTIDQQAEIFLSTPSARRATFLVHSSVPNDAINISIHALREEGDAKVCRLCMRFGISIHALREEGDTRHSRHSTSNTNFYPRPPRGGRLQNIMMRAEQIWISIHALREEGDTINQLRQAFQVQFLSTPSARRATYGCC